MPPSKSPSKINALEINPKERARAKERERHDAFKQTPHRYPIYNAGPPLTKPSTQIPKCGTEIKIQTLRSPK